LNLSSTGESSTEKTLRGPRRASMVCFSAKFKAHNNFLCKGIWQMKKLIRRISTVAKKDDDSCHGEYFLFAIISMTEISFQLSSQKIFRLKIFDWNFFSQNIFSELSFVQLDAVDVDVVVVNVVFAAVVVVITVVADAEVGINVNVS